MFSHWRSGTFRQECYSQWRKKSNQEKNLQFFLIILKTWFGVVSGRLRATKVIQSSKEVAQEIDARVMHGDHSEFLNVFFSYAYKYFSFRLLLDMHPFLCISMITVTFFSFYAKHLRMQSACLCQILFVYKRLYFYIVQMWYPILFLKYMYLKTQ